MMRVKIAIECVVGLLFGISTLAWGQNDYWSGTKNTTSDIGRTGNVGIGTTSPGEQLEVRNNIKTGGYLSLWAGGINTFNTALTNSLIYNSTGDGSAYPFLDYGNLVLQSRAWGATRDIVFVTGNTPPLARMIVDRNGNVGIGTTGPSAKLYINLSGDQDGLYIDSASNNNYSLTVYNAGGTAKGLLIKAGNSNSDASLLKVSNNDNTSVFFEVTDGNSYFSSGNVGIGTTAPTHRLHTVGQYAAGTSVVNTRGSYDFTTTGVSYPRDLGLGIISGTGYSGDIPVSQSAWTGGYGGYIGLWSDVNAGTEGSTNVAGVVSIPRGSGSGSAFGFYTNLANASSGYTKWGIYSTGEDKNYFTGNVGIGTTSPTTKLTVKGTITAEEVVVEAVGADFVFEEDYPLMPLGALAGYIQQQKHLPGIAPAAEVKSEGVSLGRMEGKLLQKIEELTLYTLAQEEALHALRDYTQRLERRLNDLEPSRN